MSVTITTKLRASLIAEPSNRYPFLDFQKSSSSIEKAMEHMVGGC